MSNSTLNPPDYEALGLTRETWGCVAVLTKREVTKYLFLLAASGVPALLSKDADGKRWHVAVRGALAANPAAWFITFRNEPYQPVTCPDSAITRGGQHPQAVRE